MEAADRAGSEAVALFSGIAASVPAQQSMEVLVQAYLSKEHVENPEIGCPIAALGSEMPRQGAAVRQAATRRIKEMLDIFHRAANSGGKTNVRERALATAATLIGAVVLARSVNDKTLSGAVLTAVLSCTLPSAK